MSKIAFFSTLGFYALDFIFAKVDPPWKPEFIICANLCLGNLYNKKVISHFRNCIAYFNCRVCPKFRLAESLVTKHVMLACWL